LPVVTLKISDIAVKDDYYEKVAKCPQLDPGEDSKSLGWKGFVKQVSFKPEVKE